MKTIKIFFVSTLFLLGTTVAIAQTKTESFNVSGNCGMCKNKIEKAAKEAGAKEASWDTESKVLTVTYKSSSTNTAKIQQKIAEVGYDNPGFKATDAAYDKLHGCCKYERAATTEKMAGCSDKCEMKDGKCSMHGKEGQEAKCNMAGHDGKDCCKKDAAKMDCCKDGKCSMPGHDGKDCCKKEDAKMDCCKDGKCSMPGHDGKDCCKKS